MNYPLQCGLNFDNHPLCNLIAEGRNKRVSIILVHILDILPFSQFGKMEEYCFIFLGKRMTKKAKNSRFELLF